MLNDISEFSSEYEQKYNCKLYNKYPWKISLASKVNSSMFAYLNAV